MKKLKRSKSKLDYGVVGWTKVDERERVYDNYLAKLELDKLAKSGQENAKLRLKKEKYSIWFDMQPIAVQNRILKKMAARKKSDDNAAKRKELLHFAAFHSWNTAEQFVWVRDAILTCFKRCNNLEDSQQEGVILDAYQQDYIKAINEVLYAAEERIFKKIGRNISPKLYLQMRRLLQNRASKATEKARVLKAAQEGRTLVSSPNKNKIRKDDNKIPPKSAPNEVTNSARGRSTLPENFTNKSGNFPGKEKAVSSSPTNEADVKIMNDGGTYI